MSAHLAELTARPIPVLEFAMMSEASHQQASSAREAS